MRSFSESLVRRADKEARRQIRISSGPFTSEEVIKANMELRKQRAKADDHPIRDNHDDYDEHPK